jgi:hypothetical protein
MAVQGVTMLQYDVGGIAHIAPAVYYCDEWKDRKLLLRGVRVVAGILGNPNAEVPDWVSVVHVGEER